ncbi:TetR/AcrR family transcriptional regulator [Rhodococcus sp. P1Y]|uniref:TetR/AcrR family transcriptional regulator n=1 Tax=Rhodococcus sp. P1Y TaxID=1302308 RepID=UPI000EB4BFAA|nr:TetR/AcrR family transcriptional regulator [Rhodococcus sp. P1Y]AYJ47960.1 TetR/AcrR family transcriptional regulator [Rhodococcus sp. P1Y]
MAPKNPTQTETRPSEARDRLLSTAAGIFYADGIRTVGVERIIAAAGVTKATFYRHYPSKEDLVLAYLRTEDETIRAHLESLVPTVGPVDLLREVVDLIAQQLMLPGYRGCAFINAAAEYSDSSGPVRRLVHEHRDWFHQFVADAFDRSGHYDPQGGADHFVLMRDGAMVGGYLSDPASAGDVLRRGIEGVIRTIHGEWPGQPVTE